jgi:maleate isomerase
VSSGFGDRARIGHIYPSGGICDHEIQMMAPPGVQFLTTRLPFRRTGLDDDRAMADGVAGAAVLLADAEVDLIAFNCTAASMLVGPDTIRDQVAAATGGIRCVTTIEAVVQGLQAVGASGIALLTPYPDEVEEAEVAYLATYGFTAVARGGPVCVTPVEQGCIPAAEWIRLAAELDTTHADAVLISCAGTQTADAIAAVEASSGLPVITSNQALLWLVLGACGITDRIPLYGRLLTLPRT